jgi:hypothetical protein
LDGVDSSNQAADLDSTFNVMAITGVSLTIQRNGQMMAGYANPTTRPMGLPTGKLLKAC